MPNGQEIAVTLPKSNAATIFAQSFLQGRASRDRKEAMQAAASNKEALRQKKEAADNEAAAVKLAQGFGSGVSSPEFDVQQGITENLAMGRKAIAEAAAKGTKGFALLNAGQQYADNAVKLQNWGNGLTAGINQLKAEYKGIDGINADAIPAIISKKIKEKNLMGQMDPTTENLRALVESSADDLIPDPAKPLVNYWGANIKDQSITVGTSRNGKNTGGGRAVTIPNDAVAIENGKDTEIVPKHDVFPLNVAPSQIENLSMPRDAFIKAQTYLGGLFDAPDGNVKLYDKENFDLLMKSEASRRAVNKLFNERVNAFNAVAANKTAPFPKGGIEEEMAKRAIVYSMRAPNVKAAYDLKNSQATFTLRMPAAPRAAKEETLTVDGYAELASALDGKVGGEMALSGFSNKVNPQLMKMAREASSTEDAAKLDAQNIVVRNVDGVLRLQEKRVEKKGTALEKVTYVDKMAIDREAFNSRMGKAPKTSKSTAAPTPPAASPNPPAPKPPKAPKAKVKVAAKELKLPGA